MKEQAPYHKTNVSKLVVVAYTDKTYRSRDSIDPYFVPVNPESYSQNYKVEYDLRRGHGQQGSDPKFKSTVPEELKLDFILDGTGTIHKYNNPNNEPVQQQFTRFKDTVYSMNGNIHRPRFLKIFWGTLVFPCILTNMDVNYSLFDPEGQPLRAKLTCTFVNYVAQEERVARENKKSPDLTHIRLMEEGDRLDLLSNEIYNDSKYVLQLARANSLTSFRNVKTGLEITFPPFDNTEE